jgi:hypothetical protein
LSTLKETRRFKKICDKYNLRYKKNEAGEPTSPSRRRNFPDDHLYDLSNGLIGVSVKRDSSKKFTFLKNKLVRMGCEILQAGDEEGNFSVDEDNLLEIAKLLSCVKKNRTFSAEERAAIRETLSRLMASCRSSLTRLCENSRWNLELKRKRFQKLLKKC